MKTWVKILLTIVGVLVFLGLLIISCLIKGLLWIPIWILATVVVTLTVGLYADDK